MSEVGREAVKGIISKYPPMRHCFYCGVVLGRYVDYDPLDTCGEIECVKAAREVARQERQDAHDKLDRDRGWS